MAAGASRRLGQPKQLLPLGGRPLLDWALGAMREFAPDRIILVLGHQAEAIVHALDLSGIEVVVNPRHAEGLSTSLQAGVAALPDAADAALMITGDQPFVTADHLRALCQDGAASGMPIAATDYGAFHGVPLLLARAAWPLLREITGDQGARPLLRAHPQLVTLVRAHDPRLGLDVDTPEGYAEVRALIEPAAS